MSTGVHIQPAGGAWEKSWRTFCNFPKEIIFFTASTLTRNQKSLEMQAKLIEFMRVTLHLVRQNLYIESSSWTSFDPTGLNLLSILNLC